MTSGVNGPGTLYTIDEDVSTKTLTNGLSNDSSSEGALADLYLGLSQQLTPRLVAGVQVEGSLAQIDFDSRSSETKQTSTNDSLRSNSSAVTSGVPVHFPSTTDVFGNRDRTSPEIEPG